MAANPAFIWGMHAGQVGDANRLFLHHGYVGLGWSKLGNLSSLPNDQTAVKALLEHAYPGKPPLAHAQEAGILIRYVHVMKPGDYVAFRPQPTQEYPDLVFLGRIAGPYLYNPYLEPVYPNTRRVEWLRSVPTTTFSDAALQELAAWQSLFQIDTHVAEFLTALAEAK